jgi:predicted Fe-Mo cluster-binding NifX family protein
MRIVIPLTNGRLTPRLGQCEEFAVVEAVAEDHRIVGIRTLRPPSHAPGAIPRMVGDIGADVIIAGDLEHREHQVFADSGLQVVFGASSESPEKLVTDYLNSDLATGEHAIDCEGGNSDGGQWDCGRYRTRRPIQR